LEDAPRENLEERFSQANAFELKLEMRLSRALCRRRRVREKKPQAMPDSIG